MRSDKILITVKLDVAIEAVFGALENIKADLVGLMGDNFNGQTQLVDITGVKSGSVILDAQLTVP